MPERENERATAKLVAALQEIQRAVTKRTDLTITGLDGLRTLFPVHGNTILTGLRWIDLDRVAAGLGLVAPAGEGAGHPLSPRIGGIPSRTAPQHDFEFPLPHDRYFQLTPRLSSKRWVRAIGVSCYAPGA